MTFLERIGDCNTKCDLPFTGMATGLMLCALHHNFAYHFINYLDGCD